MNLAARLEEYLPVALHQALKTTQKIADALGYPAYLVGGMVRDLLLDRPTQDVDIVVEGDAVRLARELSKRVGSRLTTHLRFGTATLAAADFSLDIATARSESYSRPGALPAVKPGTITEDLFRRDFTVNAVALSINPEKYGELLDPYQGRQDIGSRLIRVLHEKSFIDDATRILRAIRYEQRLGFRLEPETARLLERDIPMLNTISSERIRYDLDLILKEKYPEKILRRAHTLGILPKIHPSLLADDWLMSRFVEARRVTRKNLELPLYYALLIYRLEEDQMEAFISRIEPPKKLAMVLRETLEIKRLLRELTRPTLTPSQIHAMLRLYTFTAIQANWIASDLEVDRGYLELYLLKLRHIRPALTGDDLKTFGFTPGLKMGSALDTLLEAKLNGKVKTRKDEEKLVKQLISAE